MMNTQEILDIEFKSQDLNETMTIRMWLGRLLETLWEEGEGFSGKRPFGNSGWKGDIEIALVRAGVIDGQFEETTVVTNGVVEQSYIELLEANNAQFDEVMGRAIASMSFKVEPLPWWEEKTPIWKVPLPATPISPPYWWDSGPLTTTTTTDNTTTEETEVEG